MTRIGVEEGLNLRLPRRRLCLLLTLSVLSVSFISVRFLFRNNARTIVSEWIELPGEEPEPVSEKLPGKLSYSFDELRGKDIEKQLMSSLESWKTIESSQPREQLGRRPRILCWLMTDPPQVNRTIPARDTWMSRCDIRLIMSTAEDKSFPTIGLEDVPAGRNFIAQKSRASWTYVYKNYIDQADFFIKADPDTYIMTDNLRYFLSQCNSSKPQIYGHALFVTPKGQAIHYAAGQAVVLTREAVKRLVTEALVKYPACFEDGQFEDLKTGKCLTLVGGHVVDTRDNLGRETFLPPIKASNIRPDKMRYHLESAWYSSYRVPYGICEDMTDRCISERPVVFHRISEDMMYMIDFLERLLINARPRDIYAVSNATSPSSEQASNQYNPSPPVESLIPPRLSFNGTEYAGKVVL